VIGCDVSHIGFGEDIGEGRQGELSGVGCELGKLVLCDAKLIGCSGPAKFASSAMAKGKCMIGYGPGPSIWLLELMSSLAATIGSISWGAV